jgi:hypothetical protein
VPSKKQVVENLWWDFLTNPSKMVRSDAGEDNSKDFGHLVLSLIWDLSLPCS